MNHKLHLDKYYTSKHLAKYCIDKVYEIIGEENISETIEPSAGNGAFSEQIKHNVCWAYDIEPEHPNIIKQDFLELEIKYLQGRLIIGNPPYGRCLNLAQKFFKKAIKIGDYIAFILPISQLNNTQSFYEFDLIYSEDLGVQNYTNRHLHCCFNIYRIPDSGEFNSKPVKKLKSVIIKRQNSVGYSEFDYDLRICYWGDGTAGKILKEGEVYSAEYKIKIINDLYKDGILNLLNSFDWKTYLKCIAMRKIQQFHIIDVIKKDFPEID